ncbi:MAG TPA: hypothetical protein VHB21_07450 [Minicystis sp.]|nr:hypothetical protein [Minicystis sp.]
MTKLAFCMAGALVALTGCAMGGAVERQGTHDGTEADSAPLPEDRCSDAPAANPNGSFRHWKSSVIADLGAPRHRGLDLVATSDDAVQRVEGQASYGVEDKALEDEWVHLYACASGAWSYLGDALTDDEGHFALDLSDGGLLPVGVRDLYMSVDGDGSGAPFVAIVAPSSTEVAVSDIDGTLTSSENAFPESLVTGATVAPNHDAAEALTELQSRGYAIVYVSTRSAYFTGDTRAWLEANGFPLGALRLPGPIATLPGQASTDAKVELMSALPLTVAIGVGNRSSDAAAYDQVGVASDHTFLKTTEFSSELGPWIDGGDVGFDDYAALLDVLDTL